MKINFESRNFWKAISSVLLITMFFTFNQCVVQQFDEPVAKISGETVDSYHEDPVSNGGTLPPGGSGEFEENGATEVARLVTDIGIKDFEAIYFTYQVLTGINGAEENDVRGPFIDLKTQLPFDATIKNFNIAQQIAIIKLASEFCESLFRRSAYYNGFFNNFDINQSPNSVLSSQNGKMAMVNELINRFWGVNVQPDSVVQTAQLELSALIDDLLIGTNMNSSATTRLVAKGVCISLLSSAPVTTF
jgi:hypothetical protein